MKFTIHLELVAIIISRKLLHNETDHNSSFFYSMISK